MRVALVGQIFVISAKVRRSVCYITLEYDKVLDVICFKKVYVLREREEGISKLETLRNGWFCVWEGGWGGGVGGV